MTSNNLAQYFQQPENSSSTNSLGSYNKHSKAVDAEDDKHFTDTTFQLKRTRSVGLLDEFIAPTRKLIEEDGDFDNIASEDNQFIENVDDVVEQLTPHSSSNVIPYNDENNNEHNETDEPPKQPDEISHSSTPDHSQPHDDNDIVYEPSKHVDYLSYNWKEDDLSKSWRYIVLKRKDVANSARLENASWRTWAQAKYDLKTISPESVDWFKDSDVTWLYGPLYKEPSHNDDELKNYGSDIEPCSKTSSSSVKVKKKVPTKPRGPKPILKKRTVTEMLSQSLHHPNHNTQVLLSPPNIEDDFDLISRKVNTQYSKLNPHDSDATGTSIHPESPIISAEPPKRHIHFNDRVEQCIALNIPDSDEEDFQDYDNDDDYYEHDADDDDDDAGDDENDDDSDDEGGFFLMVKSPSTTQLHGNFVPSDDDEDEDEDNDTTELGNAQKKLSSPIYQTIELLPATTLKNCSDDEQEEFALSHNTNTSRGYNYHYDYNSVFIGNEEQRNALMNASGYEYEDTPQHLEGVSMVDVPDNIVLGSNVEILDTPQFVHDEGAPFINPIITSNHSSANASPIQSPSLPPQQSQSSAGLVRNSSSNFQFNNFDSESNSDEEVASQPFNPSLTLNASIGPSSPGAKNSNLNDSISKISSSPSYASLSDVAAQGYFAPSAANSSNNNLSNVLSGGNNSAAGSPVNEIEKDLKRSSITHDDESSEDESEKDKKTGFGFLKNWKR